MAPFVAESFVFGVDQRAMTLVVGDDDVDLHGELSEERAQMDLPDDRLVATGSWDNTAKLWSLPQPAPRRADAAEWNADRDADEADKMKLKTPSGTQQTPDPVRTQAARQPLAQSPVPNANLDHEELSVQALGSKVIDGMTYEAGKATPPAGNPLTLYLDLETHRPGKTSKKRLLCEALVNVSTGPSLRPGS